MFMVSFAMPGFTNEESLAMAGVTLAVSFVALAALVLTVCTGGVILLVDAFLSRRRI